MTKLIKMPVAAVVKFNVSFVKFNQLLRKLKGD